MKGIILAGGSGTRLHPLTKSISKQILPIYDKPMIYYPLSILMLAGITEILIISTPRDTLVFQDLLGDGKSLGINLKYRIQQEPKGLAQAFILGEEFIGNDNVTLILGDNIFYGSELIQKLENAVKRKEGATIFGYTVDNPSDFGVVEFDDKFNVISIEEKPNNPKSNYAVPGLYFYDNNVIKIAKNVKPSARGELEITSINSEYLNMKKLKVELLGRGMAWLDTGTYNGLLEASNFISTIQKRQGLYIGCIEEVAYIKGYINKEQLINLAQPLVKTPYGKYLLKIAHET
jgi:glucose-1-phosphate thymidylyltransferase